ncbi:MAG: hypothetical protein Q8Q26_18395, partial [Pseudorhodobacter sp.]|nr:hypothetical protein [Pseudorhodobacter sp.]
MTDWEEIKTTKAQYVAINTPGKIYVSDFPKGKILSTITDEEKLDGITIYKTSRTQIKATYISEKDQIIELKIQKYEIKNGTLVEPATEIRIDSNNLVTLTDFLKFLLSVNISSVAAGRLSFDKNIQLDPELESKLKLLARDPKGREQLLKLFGEGYLSSDLDIPELIKKGLSKQKIDEKKAKMKAFENLIDKPDVKEV